MQTFLPYRSFQKSAECLDYRRLGKQRVEAQQILNVLTGKRKGWAHHPAVLMWRGYEGALRYYIHSMIREWVCRGYNNTMVSPATCRDEKAPVPKWLTSKFIRAHRSNLMRKDPEYYRQFKWGVPNDLEYVWPVRIGSRK